MKLSTQRSKKRKEWRKVRRAQVTYGIPTSGLLYALWESQRWERESNRVFKERMAENFPNLGKETDIQIQEGQQATSTTVKETHNETHYNETLKISEKGDSLIAMEPL